MTVRILQGDCRSVLATLESGSVQCCVTSPPYFGLRDYGVDGQIGLEPTPAEYIAEMVAVFREVKRVLRDDGCVFLNLGDSYSSDPKKGGSETSNGRNGRGEGYARGLRVASYGTGGKAPASSPTNGCLCRSLCDACRVAYRFGRVHSGPQPVPTPFVSTPESIREHTVFACGHLPTSGSLDQPGRNGDATPGQPPCAPPVAGQLLGVQASTTLQSLLPPLLCCSEVSSLGAECQLCGRSFSPDEPASARMVACICGTEAGASDGRKTGMDASGLAYPDYTTTSPKPKDLLMIPARVALALQADGWWLRSQMPWIKRSCMPESVTDRPGSAVEYVYLFTKQENYFWDAEGVRQSASEHPVSSARRRRIDNGAVGTIGMRGDKNGQSGKGNNATHNTGTRNFRNSDLFFESLEPPHGLISDTEGSPWALDVNPMPLAESHFATFPPRLVEPLIRAGTSERGACSICGAPWVREITKGAPDEVHKAACGADASGGYNGQSTKNHAAAGVQDASAVKARILAGMRKRISEWHASCSCAAPARPCVVLDPFGGAGTTGLVADRLGRDAVLIELNPEYSSMAQRRVQRDAGLFAEVSAQ